jgi:hypothetical protein
VRTRDRACFRRANVLETRVPTSAGPSDIWVSSARWHPLLWSITPIARTRRRNSPRNAENRSRLGSISVEKRRRRDGVGDTAICFHTGNDGADCRTPYAQSANSLRVKEKAQKAGLPRPSRDQERSSAKSRVCPILGTVWAGPPSLWAAATAGLSLTAGRENSRRAPPPSGTWGRRGRLGCEGHGFDGVDQHSR